MYNLFHQQKYLTGLLMPESDSQANRDDLAQWYFAGLRKSIHAELTGTTPASLIGMDRRLVEGLIASPTEQGEGESESKSERSVSRYGVGLSLLFLLLHALVYVAQP